MSPYKFWHCGVGDELDLLCAFEKTLVEEFIIDDRIQKSPYRFCKCVMLRKRHMSMTVELSTLEHGFQTTQKGDQGLVRVNKLFLFLKIINWEEWMKLGILLEDDDCHEWEEWG